MNVEIRTKRDGDHASLVLAGPFDLAHATAMSQATVSAEAEVHGCGSIDLNLSQLDRIDGAGAVVLAQLLERLNAAGARARLAEGQNLEAERLISLYRERRAERPPAQTSTLSPLARIGALVPHFADKAYAALDSIGRDAAALPKVAAAPSTVDWRSLPKLIQQIGADALLVTSAANLLVGVIIGFLGVSQLGRFGAVAFVPQLVVVAHFRELGPLVTAIVVAGRSSAGLASEIATMKVSEEIDALRSIGFDPVRWLVVPRCLALALTLPLLTWVGYVWALVGGLAATTITTDMTAYLYTQATLDAITAGDLFAGLVKTPFLAVAIGLIACSEGLLTRGGAAAVGVRTTSAVVLSIFSVIVISAVFTFFFTLLGI
jgi:phospholipid/cholesterol/gamma-HCH transport system permease protein